MTEPTSIPGLVSTGIAGVGASGPILSGQWNGTPVTIRNARHGAVPVSSQLRRLQELKSISCEHLAKVVHFDSDGEQLTVLSEHIDGPTLTTLRAGKAGLTLAEGWRVLADLCIALKSLHSAGIIHGDISPANVIVRSGYPQGRAVVIDVGGEDEWELGTVGFRAPEVASGAPASAACDVWAAARTALWAVSQEHRAVFAELLREVLHSDPSQRPDADRLAEHAEQQASASIELPDDARLATAHLRAQAARMRTTRVGRRQRRRPRKAFSPLMVAVFFALAMATYGVLESGTFSRAQAPVSVPAAEEDQEDHHPDQRPAGPQEAVAQLTELRDHALESGNLQLLEQVSIPGSEAAQADRDLMGSFGGSAPVGIRTAVEVEKVTGTPEKPVVRAVFQQGGFTWRGGIKDGVHVAPLPPRCAQIHLARGGGEWLAERISACESEDPG